MPGPQIFTPFFQNVDNVINTYVTSTSANVISLIAPTVYTGMGLFLIFYGLRHWWGEIDEPFMAFLQTSFKMGAIVWVALSAGEYNALIRDTFQNSPIALASVFSGTSANHDVTTSSSIGQSLDQALWNAYDVGVTVSGSGHGIEGNILMGIMGAIAMCAGFVVTSYTAYLICLSKFGSALFLALWPLFVAGLLSEKTKGYFQSFVTMLINYGMVLVLAAGTNGLVINIFAASGQAVLDKGGNATLGDAVAMLVSALISVLILGQVTGMASGIAGGVSLSTQGVGRSVFRGIKKAASQTMDTATNGRGRRNQRTAEDQSDVASRRKVHEERLEARRKRREPKNELKDGTND